MAPMCEMWKYSQSQLIPSHPNNSLTDFGKFSCNNESFVTQLLESCRCTSEDVWLPVRESKTQLPEKNLQQNRLKLKTQKFSNSKVDICHEFKQSLLTLTAVLWYERIEIGSSVLIVESLKCRGTRQSGESSIFSSLPQLN